MKYVEQNVWMYSELSDFRKKQINRLAATVNASGAPEPTMSVDDEIYDLPHFFLGMDGRKPVAYGEWFYDGQGTIEIQLFVHPLYRQQGYMRSILRQMQEVFAEDEELSCAETHIIFRTIKNGKAIAEEESAGTEAVLRHLQAEEVRCDYLLDLTGRKITSEKLPDGVTYSVKKKQDVTEYYIYRDATTPKKRKKKIGYARVIAGNGRNFLCDVLISPEERGRGFGRYLVEHLAAECGNMPLLMHVDGDNEVALRLYRRIGCEVVERQAYFRVKLFSY